MFTFLMNMQKSIKQNVRAVPVAAKRVRKREKKRAAEVV